MYFQIYKINYDVGVLFSKILNIWNSKKNMALEQMGIEDREVVTKLLESYWEERHFLARSNYFANTYLDYGHKREIANDEFFVYKRDGKIIGFVSLVSSIYNTGKIRDEIMVIEDEFENMISEIIKIARLRRLRKVFALSIPDNVKYYQRLGFLKEGMLREHYVEKEDLVIMSLFLRDDKD